MEVIRILAPQEPYEEDTMKEVVQLIVDSFQHLVDDGSRHFPRRETILRAFVEVRLCNLLLDLGSYDLIHTIFQHFVGTIGEEHRANIFCRYVNYYGYDHKPE